MPLTQLLVPPRERKLMATLPGAARSSLYRLHVGLTRARDPWRHVRHHDT